MFSEYCKNKFEVEPVEVIYKDVDKSNPDFVKKLLKASRSPSEFGIYQTPDMKMRDVIADVDYINGMIGISESPESLIKYFILSNL